LIKFVNYLKIWRRIKLKLDKFFLTKIDLSVKLFASVDEAGALHNVFIVTIFRELGIGENLIMAYKEVKTVEMALEPGLTVIF